MNFKEPGFKCSPFGPPHLPGVYAICRLSISDYLNGVTNFECIYIGSSINISRRLQNSSHPHRKVPLLYSDTMTCCFFYITENYKELEIELIKKYTPIYNKQHNGKKIY